MQRIIIDTREPHEYDSSHVNGAVNIPPGEFMTGSIPKAIADFPLDDEIIVYCRTGSRSNVVGHILREHGFTNVVNGINQGHVEKIVGETGD